MWVDRNRDGQSSRDEVTQLAAQGVKEIRLAYDKGAQLDEAGNDHRYRGQYEKRLPRGDVLTFMIEDVYFLNVP